MVEDQEKFPIGDVVLLKTNTIWNQWLMAKYTDFYKGNDFHVRTVELPVGDNKFTGNSSKYLLRSVYEI